MVALSGVLADLLLERQVFFSLPQVEIAYRGRLVGAMQQDAFDEFGRTLEGDRVGGLPLGRKHRGDEFVLAADQGHVDGIAVNFRRRQRDPRRIVQGRLNLAAEDGGEELRRGRSTMRTNFDAAIFWTSI